MLQMGEGIGSASTRLELSDEGVLTKIACVLRETHPAQQGIKQAA
jgi:hypothetical protein